jgi:uncharacterized protein (DUF305 family)
MPMSRHAQRGRSVAGRRGRLLTGLVAIAAVAALMLVPAAQANRPAGAYDRNFLVDMIGHHQMAVEMAEMAGEKATHPELKAAAEEIVRTQSAEIQRMRRWLRQWYGMRNVEPKMDHEEMAQMEELEQSTGAAFEIRFLAMMSVHHAQAIERARVALRRAKHPEVRKLARAIVKAQQGEIDQFRDWLVAWYAG